VFPVDKDQGSGRGEETTRRKPKVKRVVPEERGVGAVMVSSTGSSEKHWDMQEIRFTVYDWRGNAE